MLEWDTVYVTVCVCCCQMMFHSLLQTYVSSLSCQILLTCSNCILYVCGCMPDHNGECGHEYKAFFFLSVVFIYASLCSLPCMLMCILFDCMCAITLLSGIGLRMLIFEINTCPWSGIQKQLITQVEFKLSMFLI